MLLSCNVHSYCCSCGAASQACLVFELQSTSTSKLQRTVVIYSTSINTCLQFMCSTRVLRRCLRNVSISPLTASSSCSSADRNLLSITMPLRRTRLSPSRCCLSSSLPSAAGDDDPLIRVCFWTYFLRSDAGVSVLSPPPSAPVEPKRSPSRVRFLDDESWSMVEKGGYLMGWTFLGPRRLQRRIKWFGRSGHHLLHLPLNLNYYRCTCNMKICVRSYWRTVLKKLLARVIRRQRLRTRRLGTCRVPGRVRRVERQLLPHKQA